MVRAYPAITQTNAKASTPARSINMNANNTGAKPLSTNQTSPEISFLSRIAPTIRRNPVDMAQIDMKNTTY